LAESRYAVRCSRCTISRQGIMARDNPRPCPWTVQSTPNHGRCHAAFRPFPSCLPPMSQTAGLSHFRFSRSSTKSWFRRQTLESGRLMVMRVFVAGGTGVVGRRLVPQLPSDRRPVTLTRRALGPGHPPPTPRQNGPPDVSGAEPAEMGTGPSLR